jgi:hypothetical protein
MLIENIPNMVLAFMWFNLPRAEFCCPLELCGGLVSISHLLTLHWVFWTLLRGQLLA